MLLAGKVAVIVGGSGAIGSAVAHAMVREGANVFLGARNQEKLDRAAGSIRQAGGTVETFVTDVLDLQDISEQIRRLALQTGGIDVVVNATGFKHVQGKNIENLSLPEFLTGITPFISAQFTLAKAVAPHMGGARAGAIISVVAPAASMAMPGHLGHIAGCAATEAFIKALASELGPHNIRVLGVRSHAIVDAVQAGSYTGDIFTTKAQSMGLSVEQWLDGVAQSTMIQRLPTLMQIAETITFLASDRAGAMTATVVNITAGATVS
ncbi:MAG: SDR family oxidoreductase [Acinetobacter sp.]